MLDQQTSSVQQNSSKNNHNKKTFLIIILCLVNLVLLGLVTWLVIEKNSVKKDDNTAVVEQTEGSQSTKFPAGFKEYKNEELGLKFNYPSRWGEVALSKNARNLDEYEPVKTNFLTFTENEKVSLKVSPSNWSFTGGQSTWDFPTTEESFSRMKNISGEEAQSILSLDQSDSHYVLMEWSGFDGSVSMLGAKRVSLLKVPANFVELAWSPVSEVCAEDVGELGAKVPTVSCYGQDLVEETKTLIDSIDSDQR